MLSLEDNETISRVGPGTPMGSLMREYWLPALLSSELPEPDSDPVRVMLLGERYIAFRDTDGRVGLLRNGCPHRGASLWFGRNENCGIRCAYHGWKFDVTGQCVEVPNEPDESNFHSRIRARAARVEERGGFVWAYLGPRQTPPPLPDFPSLDPSIVNRRVGAFQMECNWLQTIEGDLDTSHFGFLHVGHVNSSQAPEGSFLRFMLEDRAPRYKVIDTEVGVTYGAYRPAGSAEETYWRIAHYLFPVYSMVPVGLLGAGSSFTARMPMDDGHTMVFQATDMGGRVPSDLAISANSRDGLQTLPNGTGWYDRFRSARSIDNDFEIDREAQRSGRSFTGLEGVPLQDRAMTESMDEIVDRTEEHLGTADLMVARVRRRILAAIADHQRTGEAPPGVDHPELYRQRSGGTVLPSDADWLEATQGLRDGSQAPALDPSLSAGV